MLDPMPVQHVQRTPMIEEKTAKRKNPVRRERLNKDWPIKVYTYDCWPQEKPPQALWDTAHEMRRLWNDLTAIFRMILADDVRDEAGKPLLSKEESAVLWAPINTKPLREIAKQRNKKLDAGCGGGDTLMKYGPRDGYRIINR